MATTVVPAEFSIVDFDAGEIAAIADRIASTIALGDVDVTIDIDETKLQGRTTLESIDPIRITAQSGAFEDPKRMRAFSAAGTADVLGRHLLRARDRRQPDWSDAPADDDLAIEARSAWDVYCVGRLARAGEPVQRQRWLYGFRNRHGFTDVADDVFEQLWHADELSWSQLAALSDEASAANPGPLER